jgi:SulP family sulfate permease
MPVPRLRVAALDLGCATFGIAGLANRLRNPVVKQRPAIVGDVWGGFAAMLVAVPAAIAFGITAYGSLGPEYVGHGIRAGLVGAIALSAIAAFVGGAARVISAPSAPAAAVLGAIAAGIMARRHPADPHVIIALVGVASFFAGVLQTLFGALGGGRLIKFIPYPVVSGYLSAVGVTILTSQLPGCLGAAPGTPLRDVLSSPSSWSRPALVVGGIAIVAMLAGARYVKRVPATVLALLAGTAAYVLLGIGRPELWKLAGNTLVLGNVSDAGVFALEPLRQLRAGLSVLQFADVRDVLIPSLTLAVLLSVDSLKTCVIVDALTLTRHDSNRTLLGQGLGNAASALLAGMPGSGTMGPTLVNIDSGGRSRWSSVAEALFVLAAVLVFGSWLAWIPIAALGGILVVVAVRMFDWSSFRLLRHRSTALDFVVIATVVLTAIATNLLVAAGAGVALAMVLFIRDQIRGSVIRRKARANYVSSKQHRSAAEQVILDRSAHQILACELQGSLFFGTTDQLWTELEPELKSCRYLILDMRRVVSLDYTAAHLFAQFEEMLRSRNGFLLFSRVPARPEFRAYYSVHRGADGATNARAFDTLDDALQWAEDRLIAEARPELADDGPPPALRDFDLFRNVGDAAGMDALAARVRMRSLVAGEMLFRAGDPVDELFLVRRGVVRVTLPLAGNGYHTLATFGRGHFFGEMAFLVHGPRSADAVATNAVEVFVLSRADFDAIVRMHPEIGLETFSRIAHALAVRLRRTDTDLRTFYES